MDGDWKKTVRKVLGKQGQLLPSIDNLANGKKLIKQNN